MVGQDSWVVEASRGSAQIADPSHTKDAMHMRWFVKAAFNLLITESASIEVSIEVPQCTRIL